MEVFSLAHRFDMSELLRACADVLDECMQCDDVCRVLEAAAYYGHADLAAKCWDLIKDSAPRWAVGMDGAVAGPRSRLGAELKHFTFFCIFRFRL